MASVPPPLAAALSEPPPDPPELPQGVPRRPPPWPAWSAPVALLAAVAATFFGSSLVAALGAIGGADIADPPPGVRITSVFVQDIALILSALVFARLVATPRAWHFGLRAARWWPSAGWLAATWLGFVAFSAAWVGLLGIKDRDDLPDELGAGSSTLALIAVTFLVTIVAPVAEEFFFRGFFFAALRSWRGPWLAALVTGLVFGAIHAGSAPAGYLVPLAAFGFGLCLLYWRTGSLLPCISLHALNNSLALGVTQEWTWQIPVVMLASNLVLAAILLPLGRAGAGARVPAPAVP